MAITDKRDSRNTSKEENKRSEKGVVKQRERKKA